MDYDDFRSILVRSGVDVWTFIDTAIRFACSDHADELKHRRDGIVESLYAAPILKNPPRCRYCDGDDVVVGIVNRNLGDKDSSDDERAGGDASPLTPQSVNLDDVDDKDGDMRFGDLFDDEQTRILNIKDQLEAPEQSEESIVELLQTLADMDLTFKALKETDIGRHVNRLRKHPSNEVRRLVKQLVRLWKDLVDEWVRLNPPGGGKASSSAAFLDDDSPQQKVSRNGHHQVPDFAYSPNLHNGSSGSDKNNAEHKPKKQALANRENPTKSNKSSDYPASTLPNKIKEQKDTIADAQRLASARKRLQDNYKEAENAKKQRTIQVMDIHDIPKSKNTFFAKNKGSSQGRHR